MIISTIYDEELKQKVFQVRDEEGYTNSTKTSISYTYEANHREYLLLNLTANVEGNYGDSSVAFFDGETLLGMANFTENDTSVTLSSIQVDYTQHHIYAKYLGNVECLASKSPIEVVEVEQPEIPESVLYIQVEYDPIGAGYLTVSGDLIGIENNTYLPIENESVKIYLNDELLDTATTGSGGSFSYGMGGALDNGRYWIKCVFEGNNDYLTSETVENIDIGKSITITPTYPKIGVGDVAEFIVEVKTWDNEPVPDTIVKLQKEYEE